MVERSAGCSDAGQMSGALARSALPLSAAGEADSTDGAAPDIGDDGAAAAAVANAVHQVAEETLTAQRTGKRKPPHRDRDAVQRELCEVMGERQAFETRLRQLRAEVRLCETSLEALVQKEKFLFREASALPSSP